MRAFAVRSAALVLSLALAPLALALAVLATAGEAHAFTPSGRLEIHYINVQQGGSTLVIGPNGTTVLMEAGSSGKGAARVVPYLQSLGLVPADGLDHTLIGHQHADHLGGMDEVLQAGYDVRIKNWYNGSGSSGSTIDAWRAACLETTAGAPAAIPLGTVIDLGGGATLTVVAVNGVVIGHGPVAGAGNDENDLSIAVLIKHGAFDFIWASDLGGGDDDAACTGHSTTQVNVETPLAQAITPGGELPLLSVEGVDVVHVNHHGSESSMNSDYMNLLRPEVAVISCGAGQGSNWYHPRIDVVDKVLRSEAPCVTAPPALVLQTEEGSPSGTLTSFAGHCVGDIEISTDGIAGYRIEATGNVSQGPDERAAAGLLPVGREMPLDETPPNAPPVANAGPDQSAGEGAAVALTGAGSTDPDGDTLSYAWAQTGGPAVALAGATTATPSFAAPAVTAATALDFRLTVDDGHGATSQDTVRVTVQDTVNEPPIARAGPDLRVAPGAAVTLDGTASSDPNGEALTFAWAQTAGEPVALSGAGTASPSFTAPAAGGSPLELTLTVTDARGAASSDAVSVAVNRPPVANAGADLVAAEGAGVALDGTGSSDPDGDPLSYSWRQIAGPAVTLSGAGTAAPSFTAPAVTAATALEFELVVAAGAVPSAPDTVVVAVADSVNEPPVAAAGADQVAQAGALVGLDGSASSDPNGEALSFAWTQTAGAPVALAGADTATPSFTAPSGPAAIQLTLAVTDARGGTGSDSVTVSVNGSPAADAGTDLLAQAGALVTLDGSGSSDPDGDPLSFAWTQTAGTPVALAGAATATPSFTAPAGSAPLAFALVVSDGRGGSGSDSVTVAVNHAPAANAGADAAAGEGAPATLDGSGSSDPDGDGLSYLWTQIGGPPVALSGATTAAPAFTAPAVLAATALDFRLTVADGRGGSSEDTIRVTVEDTVNEPPTANAGPDRSVQGGQAVTLAGSGSDPNGEALTFAWTQTAGPTVSLSGATTATPSLSAPPGPAVLAFSLTVTDARGGTATDSATVTVSGGNPNEIYVQDQALTIRDRRSQSVDITVAVRVRRDSDADGVPEATDAGVSSAAFTLVVTHDTNGDGIYGNPGDTTYTKTGTTGSTGLANVQINRVKKGNIRAEVSGLTRAPYTWDPTLDADNPAYFLAN